MLPGQADGVAHASTSATAARAPAGSADGVGFNAYAAQTTRRRAGAAPASTLAATGATPAARHHPGAPHHRLDCADESEQADERATWCAQATLDRVPRRTRASRTSGAHEGSTPTPRSTRASTTSGYAWGMVIDLERLHRLQRLRRRLPGGEQHPGGRQGAGARAAARCTGSASTATSRATSTSRRRSSASRSSACTASRRPARSSARSRATVHSDRGPERHGLQPLRRHAVLLEQLPLQGAAVQLPALPGLGDRRSSSCSATRTSRCAAAA